MIVVNGIVPDSPHILSGTNTQRGMTPAYWDATDKGNLAGAWLSVDTGSGSANRVGDVAGDFEDGPGNWRQTLCWCSAVKQRCEPRRTDDPSPPLPPIPHRLTIQEEYIMPDVPSPITSPPRVPGQPYNAAAPGAAEGQTAPLTIYDAAGGSGSGSPWQKIQDGGSCSAEGLAVAGGWPDNSASSDGGWQQT
jgi:hypothetical protein